MVAEDAATLFAPGFDKDEIAERAAKYKGTLATVMDALAGPDRRHRQHASRVVNALASSHPTVLKSHAEALADALERPEPQTRWEILGALEKLVATDARIIDKALPGITTSLHDVDSGVVRLAAFRVLCSYGATTARRSEKIWPLIDDAVRVYHGDPEFTNMLLGVTKLVSGAASDSVKLAAAERMEFDAEHTKGLVGRRAKCIVECAPKRPARKS